MIIFDKKKIWIYFLIEWASPIFIPDIILVIFLLLKYKSATIIFYFCITIQLYILWYNIYHHQDWVRIGRDTSCRPLDKVDSDESVNDKDLHKDNVDLFEIYLYDEKKENEGHRLEIDCHSIFNNIEEDKYYYEYHNDHVPILNQ